MPHEDWHVDITMDDDGRESRAEARLTGKTEGALVGEGVARANPSDENVPAIGHELAVARALSDLSHQLLHATVQDIEAHTHERVKRLRV